MTDEPTRDDSAIGGGTDGYPRDTDPGTDRYPRISDRDDEQFLSETLGPLAQTWRGMKKGWWNQAGHATFLDYFLAEEKNRARMGLRSIYRQRKKRPKTGHLPDVTPAEINLEDVESDATRPKGSRNRQVNVKLTDLGYEALAEAARTYGLRPTTLARLLIHRGALAVLEGQED